MTRVSIPVNKFYLSLVLLALLREEYNMIFKLKYIAIALVIFSFLGTGCKKEEGSVIIYILNSFSPDYDGINDCSIMSGTDIVEFKMKIYNTNGNLFFEVRILRRNGMVVPNRERV